VFDIRGRLTRLVSGRAELREFISRHSRAPELWHKHLLIEPLITIDGDTATCTAYFAVVMEIDGEPALRVFGRYLDRLVKEADGCWRFGERIAEVEAVRPGPPLAYGRRDDA
jgi:hypothetical protein